MIALLDLARRGWHPRRKGPAPAAPTSPRLGQGPGRDRTPSPVPSGPDARPAVAARSAPRSGPWRSIDPRWYQIAMLSALLAYGMFGLGFDLGWAHVAAVIGAALGTQLLCTALCRLPRFDPLSALISGIGLCTLLRTNGTALAMLAAVLAIASKFILRWRGKHLYNPTNLALVVMLIAGAGWISPGQYGHLAFVALLMVCMGLTVVCKAARSDVTLAFLGVYAAILFGRSLWLGEPMGIPIHRMQSGLLLQFAFNMISDPRTTPDSRRGRVLFGALVALGAGVVQFVMFRTNGPVWSLAVCTLLVPLLDRWLPGPRHQWKPIIATAGSPPRGIVTAATAGAIERGVTHETPVPVPGAAAALRHALARLRP
jgi:enediyne biosynthesis protein E5